MSEEQKDAKTRLEVMMPMEFFAGRYANFMRVSHTQSEFILDFCMADGSVNAHSVARVLISPVNIKNIANVILTNVARYEETFGIELPEHPDKYLENGIIKKKSK